MADSRRTLLYLTTIDPTVSSTGTTTRAKLFLQALTAKYHVHVVHFADPDDGVPDGVLTAKLASQTVIPYSKLGYFGFSQKFYAAAASLLARVPVDFIFADFEKAGLYARLLSDKFSTPYLYGTHNVEYQRYLSLAENDWRRYLLVPFMYAIERFACQGAAMTIAISEEDATSFRRWVPHERVISLPSAFDETRFHPFADDIATERPIVLTVGNYLNPGNRDGAEQVVEHVIPEVARRHPKVLFRFIGMGFPTHLSHPNMEVAGFVPDLVDEYRKAAAVLVPIRMGGGIKIKAVEGLACGRHVISTLKGMEGIDYDQLASTQVAPIKEFADRIDAVLRQPRQKTTANWDFVRRRLGNQTHMRSIMACIDRIIDERDTALTHPTRAIPEQI